MTQKNTAAVFGLTADHLFAVASVMMDLRRHTRDWIDEVVVFHDGVSVRQQRLIQEILPTRFIRYRYPSRDSVRLNRRTLTYFSQMVFSKFECLGLLEEYSTVIWFDYDIVIQSDVSELSEPSVSGIKMLSTGSKVRVQFHDAVAGYDMDAPAMSTGTFVLQQNLACPRDMLRFCYEKTAQYAPKLKLPEQAIFDLMIQEFGLDVEVLDRRVYAPHPRERDVAEFARIVHAYGQPKFWNGIYNDQWNANYLAWLKSGGRPYRRTPARNAIRGVARRLTSGVRKWF